MKFLKKSFVLLAGTSLMAGFASAETIKGTLIVDNQQPAPTGSNDGNKSFLDGTEHDVTGTIAVGWTGNGVINVSNGSTLKSQVGIINIGAGAGSTESSSVMVNGKGSSLIAGQNGSPASIIVVGGGDPTIGSWEPPVAGIDPAPSQLTLSNGATASADSVGVGLYKNGTGILTIFGPGSTLNAGTDSSLKDGLGNPSGLTIGDYTGYQPDGNGHIINYDGGKGQVTVADGGTINASEITFGGYSRGDDKSPEDRVLNINTGGQVNVGQTIRSNTSNYEFNLSGGTLSNLNGSAMQVNTGVYISDSVNTYGNNQDGSIIPVRDTNGQTVTEYHFDGMDAGRAVLDSNNHPVLHANGANTGVLSTINAGNGGRIDMNGTISGTGGLHITGTGLVALNGKNTYQGITLIDGHLQVNGDDSAARGTTYINSNASLSGKGIVGGDVVIRSGAVLHSGIDGYPGTTLTINGKISVSPMMRMAAALTPTTQSARSSLPNGKVLMQQNSMLQSDIYQGKVANLLETGSIDFAAGSTVDLADKDHSLVVSRIGQNYGKLVSTNKGVNLINNGVTEKISGNTEIRGVNTTLTAPEDLAYARFGLMTGENAEDVFLESIRNDRTYTQDARTHNEKGAAGLMDRMNPTSDMLNGILTVDQAHRAENALSGEGHASVRTVMANDAFYLRQAAVSRLASVQCDTTAALSQRGTQGTASNNAACDDKPRIWGQAYGGMGRNSGDGNAAGINQSIAGFIVGGDTNVGNGWRVGGMFSYAKSMFNVSSGRDTSGNSNDVSIGGYAGRSFGAFKLRTGFSYTRNFITTNRRVRYDSYSDHAHANYGGNVGQVFAESAYALHAGKTTVEPFVDMTWLNVSTTSFNEHGGNAALHGQARNANIGYSSFGVRVSRPMMIGKALFTPYASAAYRRAFGKLGQSDRYSFRSGNYGTMGISGVPIAQDTAVVNAGVTSHLTNAWSLDVSYVGQYASGFNSSGGQARFRYTF